MDKRVTCRTIVLAFDESIELPHIEKTFFRINKKIFFTLDVKQQRALVKSSPVVQSVFYVFDTTTAYPSFGAWGKQGKAVMELKSVNKGLMKDAIGASCCNVASRSLTEKYI